MQELAYTKQRTYHLFQYNYIIFISIGKMFPTQALLYTAPFSDETLYMEQYTKASFWYDELYIIANDRGDVVCPPKE